MWLLDCALSGNMLLYLDRYLLQKCNILITLFSVASCPNRQRGTSHYEKKEGVITNNKKSFSSLAYNILCSNLPLRHLILEASLLLLSLSLSPISKAEREGGKKSNWQKAALLLPPIPPSLGLLCSPPPSSLVGDARKKGVKGMARKRLCRWERV